MSENLLKALMQLFALASDVDDLTSQSRDVVEQYLNSELNQDLVGEYLKLYDEYVERYHQLSLRKIGMEVASFELDSEEVAQVCNNINKNLLQKQKIIVLIRLLEYIFVDGNVSDHEANFLSKVSEIFNISNDEYKNCFDFVEYSGNKLPANPSFLEVNNQKDFAAVGHKHIYSENVQGKLVFLNIESVQLVLLRYFGSADLYLNGININTNKVLVFTQGSSVRSPKVSPIYYSDVISRFLVNKSETKIVFKADDIEYHFKSGAYGLHRLSFSEESGSMVGIMGGSGSGKSTLLNILNGNYKPSRGKVSINGIDIHKDKNKIEGVIGYVSQDDLLIEELTVFQNLYYNAKLCFDGFSNKEITKIVTDLLNSLGLIETKDLKVGSPMDKTISGGQRKRLNIGLELIREPSVLFVDEPTSGLSSRDSENIMDLLKQLALKGKVVFVVIHQPSSEIFKMFDKLIIVDLGGYPIYYGNPVDSVIYFKTIINHINCNESECSTCGNVNPEQIFNIIEAKVLDEYGNPTDSRKISSKEWNALYREKIETTIELLPDAKEIPKSTFNIPNAIKQFGVFITRDVLSKLTNTQYLLINMLEAPVLALVLAYFVKFFNEDVNNTLGYNLFENENIPAYMFMAVIVALFIGLTVSAEEIIRDQKIRKRESFLNLSNGSYLMSKILIMFAISAIQTLTFVLVANSILHIQGMYFAYWVVLFSAACFANMLGLNISASFNSAVTIYILIPFLLIPQLIFSGVIVKFEKLNPVISSQTHVPLIGELMASRWAFEALAVKQFRDNKYEKNLYDYDRDLSIANFKKVYWIPELKAKIGYIENNFTDASTKEDVKRNLLVLRNEIEYEMSRTKEIAFTNVSEIGYDKINKETLQRVKEHLDRLKSYYNKMYNVRLDERDAKIAEMQKGFSDGSTYADVKHKHKNQSLSDLVMEKTELKKIIEVDGRLVQQQDPIYLDSEKLRSHFFAPRKKIQGKYYDTFLVNLCMLWLMTITLAITLYYDVFRKLLNLFSKISFRKKK